MRKEGADDGRSKGTPSGEARSSLASVVGPSIPDPHVPPSVVALFNASDDTVEMVRRMLRVSGYECLVGCHLADLKKGTIDFAGYVERHQPDVFIFDISPPYVENWRFFQSLHSSGLMRGRGVVLTTPNKERLDEAVGRDSAALEIVGKPYDLGQIASAIQAALKSVEHAGGPPVAP